MIKKTALLITCFLLVTNCKTDPNKHIEEGRITKNTYINNDIGWSMSVPKDWDITHQSEVKERSQKGLDIIQETTGVEINDSQLKMLLNFQKNKFNIFQSTIELFEQSYEGEWKENNQAIKQLLFETYQAKGIASDSSATKTIKIDGVPFQFYSFTIYDPKGKVLLEQEIYSQYRKGYDFSVNLNTNNETDKKELLYVWLNSKFEK